MKVEEYLDLIAQLYQAFNSLRSATTPAERLREAAWVKRAARELMAADCPRARTHDRRQAELTLDTTTAYLIKHDLADAK